MEKPLYPSYYMRITQGYNVGTHTNSFAIDDGGKDQGIGRLRAPYTGIIRKIYQNDANEVWLESVEPVQYPDGTIDFMTIMFAHSNDVSDLFVGKRINQGEEFYSEGTKGNATGNHVHIECGQGKFTGTGWYKNNSGYYSINNGKRPQDCLWIDNQVTVLNNNNYDFKILNTVGNSPNIPNEDKPIEDNLESEDKNETGNNPQPPTEDNSQNSTDNNEKMTAKLIYTCEKNDLYGIYLKKGQKLYLE